MWWVCCKWFASTNWADAPPPPRGPAETKFGPAGLRENCGPKAHKTFGRWCQNAQKWCFSHVSHSSCKAWLTLPPSAAHPPSFPAVPRGPLPPLHCPRERARRPGRVHRGGGQGWGAVPQVSGALLCSVAPVPMPSSASPLVPTGARVLHTDTHGMTRHSTAPRHTFLI